MFMFYKMATEMSDSGSEEEFSSASEGEDIEEGNTKKKTIINNREGLIARLNDLLYNGDWIQTLDVTIDTSTLELPNAPVQTTTTNTSSDVSTVHDDFQREMKFYCQAQVAAREGLEKLKALGVETERPEDYFAEMVKTDSHMQKIREKLASKKKAIEGSEKAKKMRNLKKFGKKVQQEVLEKRRIEKKKSMHTVDQMRKKAQGKIQNFDAEDQQFNVSAETESMKRKSSFASQKKRKSKVNIFEQAVEMFQNFRRQDVSSGVELDQKYGFGGKKRKLKSNSAESSGDMYSFKSSIHSKPSKNGKGGNKNKRPGKSARKHGAKGKR